MIGHEVLVQFLRIIFLTLAWLFCICAALLMPVPMNARWAMVAAIFLAMSLQHVQGERRAKETADTGG